jgi:hypothetical protein
MEWFNAFWENWILDAAGHFLLASALGFAACWLTQIMLYVPLSIISNLRRSPISRVVTCGMLVCSLLLGIAFALISHAWLDGFVSWWQTPLSPPLDIGGISF